MIEVLFSMILSFATGVFTAHNLFAVMKKKRERTHMIRRMEQDQEFIKNLGAKNEVLNEMQQVYYKAKEEALNNAINELMESFEFLNDGEEGKVLESLKKYNALLDMGARLNATPDSQIETSDDLKALSDTIIKNLENKDKKVVEN